MQDLGLGQVLAAIGEAHPRQRLVEQPYPGAAAGDLLLVQQLLDLVGELVRPRRAQVAQPRPVPRERLARRDLRLQRRLVQLAQAQLEEQKRRGDPGHALLAVLVELADAGVVERRRVAQLRVAHDARERLLDALVFRDGCRQGVAVDRLQLPVIGGREPLRGGFGLVEVAGELGRVRPGIQVVQVPAGQAGRPGVRASGMFGGGVFVRHDPVSSRGRRRLRYKPAAGGGQCTGSRSPDAVGARRVGRQRPGTPMGRPKRRPEEAHSGRTQGE